MNNFLMITITILLIFAIAVPLLLYFINFNGSLSDISSDWGNFGSFFGGTVSPILNTITIVFLYITLRLQNKQLLIQNKQIENEKEERNKELEETNQQLKNIKIQNFNSQFNNMIAQKRIIIDAFKRGSLEGTMALKNDIQKIIDNKEYIERNRILGMNPQEKINKEDEIKHLLTRYLNLFNFMISICLEVRNSNLNNDESKYYYRFIRYSLTDEEIKLLILCKSNKEISEKYNESINNILGEFDLINEIDIINNHRKNIYEIAEEKSIIRFQQ